MQLFQNRVCALNGRERDGECPKTGTNAHNGHVYVTQGSAGCDWLENGGDSINRPSKLMW